MLTGRELLNLVRDAGDDALERVANELLDRAKRDVPVGDPALDPDPTEVLRQSGYVRRLAPGVFEVGFSSEYAAKQHEDQRLKHPRGGKSKFLEDNAKAFVPQLDNIVAAEVHARTRAR